MPPRRVPIVPGAEPLRRRGRSVRSVGRRSRRAGTTRASCKPQEVTRFASRETMAPAPPVGPGFFPLDEELALVPGNLTPRQQEHLVHLATWMPFARAVQMLERVVGVQVSEPTVRRQAEAAGAQVEAVQTAKAYTSEPEESWEPGAARQVMSADGAYVPLLNGEWAEVRTVAIGEVQEERSTPEE